MKRNVPRICFECGSKKMDEDGLCFSAKFGENINEVCVKCSI